ncbi:MAG: RNA polymerase factor sigma-54 [Thermomicrobiales bacterium]|nr:RNA polymerase factor sigma-54 [Thermomicrobiales bacterium]
MDQQLIQHHEQRQQALPRLIEANYLLQLSSQSLETVIAGELHTNPALELTEAALCPRCGGQVEGDRCPTCRDDSRSREESPLPLEMDSESFHTRREESDLDVDQFSLIATGESILGSIRADAFASLPARDHDIASLIIESIDERGWLTLSTDEVSRITRRSPKQVERVLHTVQSIAPPGVAARDLAECLRLQADDLLSQGVDVPSIILRLEEADFADLATQKYQRIAERHGGTDEDVQAAHAFMRDQLTPNPLQDRNVSHWRHADSTQRIFPDVVVRIVNDEIIVSLANRTDSRLAINEDYMKISSMRKQKNAALSLSISDQEWEHIRSSLRSARDFLSKLEQRRRTLLKIAALVCERQEAFLRGGVREIVPLTRSEIAAELGVNESTVSRATANKYVMLPNRSVVPFSDFFTASLGIKDVIKEIIASEARRGQTLSDQRICDMLSDRGFRIARRTVTKYRLQLDILPSTQRHTA